jgi:hypothetical protein
MSSQGEVDGQDKQSLDKEKLFYKELWYENVKEREQ